MFIIRLCVYVTNSAGLDCYYKKGSLIKPTQSVYLQFVLPVKDSLLIWLPLLLTPLLSSMFQCLNLEIWWSVIKKKKKKQNKTKKKQNKKNQIKILTLQVLQTKVMKRYKLNVIKGLHENPSLSRESLTFIINSFSAALKFFFSSLEIKSWKESKHSVLSVEIRRFNNYMKLK